MLRTPRHRSIKNKRAVIDEAMRITQGDASRQDDALAGSAPADVLRRGSAATPIDELTPQSNNHPTQPAYQMRMGDGAGW